MQGVFICYFSEVFWVIDACLIWRKKLEAQKDFAMFQGHHLPVLVFD